MKILKDFNRPKQYEVLIKKPRKRGPEHGNYKHGHGKNRDYDTTEYRNWLDQVHKKFKLRCFLTKKTKEEANGFQCHHLDSWDTHPEKRYDPDNGVLLAKDVHLLFHKKYGHGGNTREQFEQFARDEYNITTFPWQDGNHEPSVTNESVQTPILTQQEKRLNVLKEIAMERGHFVSSGNDGTNSQSVEMYCSKHNKYQTVNVGKYKKAKLGLKCCEHESKSLGAKNSNKKQAEQKALKKRE